MRFESLVAYAFGPLQNQRLDFTEGLNIIHGPNESGKSSWHAALYAGLCGMRRGRGQRNEDQEFAGRHRPWDGSGWRVALTLLLQDGRRLELLQDLDSRTATVKDAELGRDYAGEIIYDGAPDGSCWLGLNREVFPAIACVKQGQIIEVLEDPEALQRHLQQAADTQGTEGTAAQAIDALRRFRSQQVGIDRANARRPLRLAREACDESRERLRKALDDHGEYELLLSELALKRTRLAEIAGRRRFVGALRARLEAAESQRLFDEVRSLHVRFPDGPPAGTGLHDDRIQDATAVLEAFRLRPAEPVSQNPSVQELEHQLSLLPEPPGNELKPDPAIAQAYQDYSLRKRILDNHQSERPSPLPFPERGGSSADMLKTMAAALEEAAPMSEPEFEQRYALLSNRVAAGKARRVLWLAGAILAAAAAGICLLLDYRLPGLILLVSGCGLAAWFYLGGIAARLKRDMEELKRQEALRGQQIYEKASWIRRMEDARRRAETLGLAADPAILRKTAERILQAEERGRQIRDWEQRGTPLERDCRESRQGLSALLEQKGESVGDDPEMAYSSYCAHCRQRSERSELLLQLERAREAAVRAEEDHRRLADIRLRLQELARGCEITGNDLESLASGIADWLGRQKSERALREEALRQWQQLQDLLNGRSPGELEEEALQLRDRAMRLSSEFDPDELQTAAQDTAALRQQADDLEGDEKGLETEIVRLQTRVEERERLIIPVAEAEEALKAAEDDLARIRRLDWILENTLAFLEKAQQQVHRSIAPALAASMRGRLPAVTSGRYTDVRVDPQNLRVSVQEAAGAWREAPLLSHGTMEQIYLLLRIALTRYLVQPGETSPLLLDDVTVQSDAERTQAMLETLLSMSEERQIVLFSQEGEVLEWAQAKLTGPRHRLTLLDPPSSPANHETD